MKNAKTFQTLVQDFFNKHLAAERNAGANTVAAYRDAIKLFLNYTSNSQGGTPDQLGMALWTPRISAPFSTGYRKNENVANVRATIVSPSLRHLHAMWPGSPLNTSNAVALFAKYPKPESSIHKSNTSTNKKS